MAMYRLSIRMDKPDRLTYESVRRQDRGKSYEVDVQLKGFKPGYQITDLKQFIRDFITFVMP